MNRTLLMNNALVTLLEPHIKCKNSLDDLMMALVNCSAFFGVAHKQVTFEQVRELLHANVDIAVDYLESNPPVG